MSSASDKKYLLELARQYPSRKAAASEIIRLNAILNLPKGTEHFLSDLHGEWEAFSHIRRNASGVIRHKINLLFGDTLTDDEAAELACLIYYPEEKLEETREGGKLTDEWYKSNIGMLLEICRLVGSKYTRAIVREHLRDKAGEYAYIIEELIADGDDEKKTVYCESITKTAQKILVRVAVDLSVIDFLCSRIRSIA